MKASAMKDFVIATLFSLLDGGYNLTAILGLDLGFTDSEVTTDEELQAVLDTLGKDDWTEAYEYLSCGAEECWNPVDGLHVCEMSV